MDNEILRSIEERRNTLYGHYDLPPDERAKAEELFGRMEELGRGCTGRAEFETKFAGSQLGGEYNGLFPAFARHVRLPEGTPSMEGHTRNMAASQAESVVRGQAERGLKSVLVQAMPDEVHQCYTQGVYRIPVLGNILSAMNTADVFRRLFRRRNTEKNDTPRECGQDPDNI